MAMTTCRECSRDVSDQARACPHCGSPKATEHGSIAHGSRELLKLLVVALILGMLLYLLA